MQINITGHQMAITPALKAFTKEKFDKLTRHHDKIRSAHVIFDVEKIRQIAEATVHVSQGDLHARSESEDMYTAINVLVDKLDRQLLKHKSKIRGHRE